MKPKARLLVTGVGGGSVGHQILHAVQLLGDRYHVVATDADPFSFGLYLVPDRHVVPLASAPDYPQAMLDLVRREKIDALLPGTEAEIRVLVGLRGELAAAGCRLVASPAEGVALCSDKARLYEWLAEHGFGVPKSARVDGWKALASEVGFPLVGKPAGAAAARAMSRSSPTRRKSSATSRCFRAPPRRSCSRNMSATRPANIRSAWWSRSAQR